MHTCSLVFRSSVVGHVLTWPLYQLSKFISIINFSNVKLILFFPLYFIFICKIVIIFNSLFCWIIIRIVTIKNWISFSSIRCFHDWKIHISKYKWLIESFHFCFSWYTWWNYWCIGFLSSWWLGVFLICYIWRRSCWFCRRTWNRTR